MELNHYTLSQLLTAYAADSTIVVRVEPGYTVEFVKQKGLQVKTVVAELGAVTPPSQHADVVKRLYKMRFKSQLSTSGVIYRFGASISDTEVLVTVMKGVAIQLTDTTSPCVSLDLSKKTEAPVVAINVGEPRPAANEDHDKDEVRSYTLNHIILPYEAMYLQTTFSLKFDFSRVKAHAGVEKCGFICTPNMDRIISDLSYLKTSASPELCQVFDNIKNLNFIQGVAYDDDIAVYLATKDDTTIRVTVIKEAELDEAHAQIPEPVKVVKDEPKTMKEVAISWLRKIFS
ncbi:hypothetical protein phiA829_007 [Aeromonas phage phiA8-29]|uniref:Uncharacterized protein n=1 Tax=Aeromonas phage phiA8-29 TaxID=1978922 RepID=A0A1W6DXU0_9CAUD|nr:hypothetical protein HWB15_gp008 [Aeromonas phage phiA8-29]ARK07827.1 hypothetical protein phiA829_007 [Aeromonas phage phiA8-29]